ncbi:MAG: hypothetical protein QNK37_36745 [Acidobacteriota bacterium]|nr:hypothetical protein [Acidobacteriota bacterium]
MRSPAGLIDRLIPYRWMASIILLVLLDFCTWLAVRPVSTRQVISNQDKFLHVLGFFGLYCTAHVVLFYDFFPRIRRFHAGLYLINASAWLGYGLLIEGVQGLLSYRTASLADFLADALGILAGAVFVAAIKLYPQGADTADGTR